MVLIAQFCRMARPMKKRRRRPHDICCPCLFWCGMSWESCHFYTDLGCYCCSVRGARPDGRDLWKHLKLMPESLEGETSHFRFHAGKALAAERAASWGDAIRHYEACRQALSKVEEKLPRSLHLWLLMWTSTPLVILYHVTVQEFAKSIEISEMLIRCLLVRRNMVLLCWKFASRKTLNFRKRHRCRERLLRIFKELQVAHDALDRDRRLVYYEWSHHNSDPTSDHVREETKRAFEEGATAEHTLCQWLSKLHKYYGNIGMAVKWASIRKEVFPQCSNHDHSDEDWRMELSDALLQQSCGDNRGYKDKLFALRDKLEKSKGQDGKVLDPEGLSTVEDFIRDDIRTFSQFYSDLPLKQGTSLQIPSTDLPPNQYRVTSNGMDDVADHGLKLKLDWERLWETEDTILRSQRFDKAVSFYRNALDKLECQKSFLLKKKTKTKTKTKNMNNFGPLTGLRNKYDRHRLDLLDKLATLFIDHYHVPDKAEDGRAMKDLDTAIDYCRKLYFYTWMQGSRADDRILQVQTSLGHMYGIKPVRFFNGNEFLHDQKWNSTLHKFDHWHVDSTHPGAKIELDLVNSQCPEEEAMGESEVSEEWVEQKYRELCITGFIKAWRRSTEHNKIAAKMCSIILHSLRVHSPHLQLDDTWATYSLSDHDMVYDGLQARIEEEMKMKQLLSTCCKRVSVEKKILDYLEIRNSSTSSPKSLPWALPEKAYSCSCEGFIGNGRPVNSIMSPAQEALLWTERNRTCSLVQQLLPNRLHPDAFDKLHNFDVQDQVAWDIITEARKACTGKRAVMFVEYSYCHYDQVFYAYVLNDQDDQVEMRSLPFQDEAEMESRVRDVLRMLSKKNDKKFAKFIPKMKKILKELYFILIDTIADLLEPMKNDDKLVIVPFEGLNELPFQLLLDPDGKYLFEKFVISITPSLRTTKYLSERLCTLQRYSLKDGEAGLVVGDPAFLTEDERLVKSRKEVGLISSMFEEKRIFKLLGTDASVENVVDWGRRPSAASNDQHEFCQAFVHIATHGIVDNTHKKGALKLAHPRALEWEDSDDNSNEDPAEDVDEDTDVDSEEDTDADEDSEMPGISSSNEHIEAASEQNSNTEYSLLKAASGCRNQAVEDAMESTEDDMSEKIDSDDAVATQASAEIGGVIKRCFRYGSEGAASTDMLSSDDIIGCGFDWRAYMVVLSACDSGKGKVLSEGILNLPRAFLIAGVPCIVASQWPVDDELTPTLMKEFYGNMKRGSDVATALCHSMRLMRSTHENDLHKWGTFNVWGLPTVCLPEELQATPALFESNIDV